MPTPSIQILRTDAQQVLNLDSISAVRSVVAATLANANAGTPLNPNLTTQQLWNEFYQIVTQPKSDIESIIANQLMKFLYAPPAPGGAGADKQVIFNDGGVLAGDPGLTFDKVTNALTITGDLTVDTNVLKVDSANDRVGIKTATPRASFALDVLGNVALGNSTTTTSNRLKLDCSGTAGNVAIMSFAAAGTNKAFYGLSGGFLGDTSTDAMVATDAAGASIRFFVSDTATEVARFNSTGNLAFANGKGIDFSATPNAPGATSELLNDYEEGTFTPGITFGGANVGMTGTFNGRYTKVGRSVTVNGLILLTAKGSSTGTALITGLPFTSSNAAGSYWSASLRNSAVSFTDVFQGYMGPNSTVIVLEQVTNAGADTVLTASNFPVGLSVLIFSCTYDV